MTSPRDKRDDDSMDGLSAQRMHELRKRVHRDSGNADNAGSAHEPTFASTMWRAPSQHYRSQTGGTMQGDKDYIGATPSWVIRECLRRWAKPGDTVLDPMCGSGTTLDVAVDMGCKGIGFDLVSRREDIGQADARALPLGAASVDFVFMDPPYSTHINYSNHPDCIGRLDSLGSESGRAYFEACEGAVAEAGRVLRPQGHMAVFVSDSSRDGVVSAIGFRLFAILSKHFVPVEIVCVERGSHKLAASGKQSAAGQVGRYMMRGFSYLLVMRRGSGVGAMPGSTR